MQLKVGIDMDGDVVLVIDDEVIGLPPKLAKDLGNALIEAAYDAQTKTFVPNHSEYLS